MSPEELRLAMERYGIEPNDDGSASMVVNGQTMDCAVRFDFRVLPSAG